jgi:hypothetical protein
MIPSELKADDFRSYPGESRRAAVGYLEALRRLPPAICPSFLVQIRNVPTNFPAETTSLHAKLELLKKMPISKFAILVEPLDRIHLPDELLHRDWVDSPAAFVTAMTAHLWSSGQIDLFREGTQSFFAALPEPQSQDSHLLIVVLGRDAKPSEASFGKLRRFGLVVHKLEEPDVSKRLLQVIASRAANDPSKYAHWYIDGGTPWSIDGDADLLTQVSYGSLAPLRMRVLARMKDTIVSGDAGTEAMQTRLSGLTPEALRADDIVSDRVLQRFYTELFTMSSGPQIFSTSFVQWTGRELMRRAQPRTILLRYAPRQHHRTFNEMVAQVEAETVLDPEGSLRDAEMGAYYAWLEASRMVPVSMLTTLVWLEGTSKLLVVAPGAPSGTDTNTALTIDKILMTFT